MGDFTSSFGRNPKDSSMTVNGFMNDHLGIRATSRQKRHKAERDPTHVNAHIVLISTGLSLSRAFV
jgi:hypothetical protein